MQYVMLFGGGLQMHVIRLHAISKLKSPEEGIFFWGEYSYSILQG